MLEEGDTRQQEAGRTLNSPARSAHPTPGPRGLAPTCPGGGRSWGGAKSVRGMHAGPCKGPDITPHQHNVFRFLAPQFVGLKNGGWAVLGSHSDDSGDEAGALTRGTSVVCVPHGTEGALRSQA